MASKITFVNNGSGNCQVQNHRSGYFDVAAGETYVLALDHAKDMVSQAFLKNFYDQYANILDITYDIADYPLAPAEDEETSDDEEEGGDTPSSDPEPEPEPEVTKYTVTFDTDGGSEVAAQEVESGKKATRPADDPTKDEATFGGWYADAGKETEFDFDTAITENTTIYAKWSAAGAKKGAGAAGIDAVKAPAKATKKK